MDMFFGLIGFVGCLVFLGIGIVSLIRKKSAKKSFIFAGIGFVMLVIGLSMTPIEEETTVEVAKEVMKEEVKEEPKEEVKKEEPKKVEPKAEVKKEEPKKEVKKEEPKKVEKPSLTLAQENAVKKAESYLDFTSFSKKGLIEQLEFDGFSTEDSTLAVGNMTVDWSEQAVLKGKSYLDFTSFSRSGLIDQLVFDGFSAEEATHAVDVIGL